MKKTKPTNRISLNRADKLSRTGLKRKSAPAKKKRFDYLKIVCWIVVPVITIALILLDAFGVYIFNSERLLVLGVGLIIILLPFFSEITVKDLSVKRNKSRTGT